MSADNWGVCPKCLRDAWLNHESRVDRLSRECAAAYGKIPADEYMALAGELEELESDEVCLEETWREDYESYVEPDGRYCVYYKGSCTVCDLRWEFRKEGNILEEVS